MEERAEQITLKVTPILRHPSSIPLANWHFPSGETRGRYQEDCCSISAISRQSIVQMGLLVHLWSSIERPRLALQAGIQGKDSSFQVDIWSAVLLLHSSGTNYSGKMKRMRTSGSRSHPRMSGKTPCIIISTYIFDLKRCIRKWTWDYWIERLPNRHSTTQRRLQMPKRTLGLHSISSLNCIVVDMHVLAIRFRAGLCSRLHWAKWRHNTTSWWLAVDMGVRYLLAGCRVPDRQFACWREETNWDQESIPTLWRLPLVWHNSHFLTEARTEQKIPSLSTSFTWRILIEDSFTVSTNVVVWKGCGLGGGSLVNSNVSIKPEPRVFANWPAVIPTPFQSDTERRFKMIPSLLKMDMKELGVSCVPINTRSRIQILLENWLHYNKLAKEVEEREFHACLMLWWL